ncbi:MAG: glycosyltransferase, partial [Okeania sp. SIO2D1]|nr:glycosyltransferase [Okeania sp. SIO2D1]
SSKPLKIWSYIGISISLISFLYATFLVIRTLIFGIDLPGYASLIVAILFLGGMQLLSLGILGEYLGRIHNEVKRRPLYLVRESYGFKNQITRSE